MRRFFLRHGICPKKVVQQAIVGRLLGSVDLIQLLKARKALRDTAVKCKKLAVDDSRDGQLVKHLHHLIVAVHVVFCEHLIAKIVTFSAISRLVVAPQQEDLVRVFNFHAK